MELDDPINIARKPPTYEQSFACHGRASCWSKRNGDVKPKDVFKSSHNEYWFDCDRCKHELLMALSVVSSGHWCGYCGGKKLCENINCSICFERSFASNKKSDYWSDKNNLTPYQVSKYSRKRCLFKCSCNHEFSAIISNITNGDWCQYCSEPKKKLCDDLKCIPCRDNSFASHEYSKYFSKDNGINPAFIFLNSHTKYEFDCPCGHLFYTKPNDIVSGSRCPYCCKFSKKLCEDHSCLSCYQKSFASTQYAKY